MSMELRHLRAFLAVADTLHFGRAAERLHVSLPALSRAIRALEDAVGAELLTRTTRKVELTPAGTIFLEECRHGLATIERAGVVARRAASGDIGHLTVTYMDFAINGALPRILERFRHRYPDIHVQLFHMPTAKQRDAIVANEIDVGFLIGPFRSKGFRALEVHRERLMAVLPKNHRLASRKEIALAELAGEAFIFGSPDMWSAYRGIITDLCLGAGFQPRIVQEASTSAGVFGLVDARLGVTIYPECGRVYRRQGLRFRPLTGISSRISTTAVWRRTSPSPALARFIAVVEDFVRDGV